MADDKLKTSPESPVQETNALGETQESAAPDTGPTLQAEQSVIPGMGEDNLIRSALGEVVVDFDKINELMS